jgi:hypothetical protein
MKDLIMNDVLPHLINGIFALLILGIASAVAKYFVTKALNLQEQKIEDQCRKLSSIDIVVRTIEKELVRVQENTKDLDSMKEKLHTFDILQANFISNSKQINKQIENLTKKLDKKKEDQ